MKDSEKSCIGYESPLPLGATDNSGGRLVGYQPVHQLIPEACGVHLPVECTHKPLPIEVTALATDIPGSQGEAT